MPLNVEREERGVSLNGYRHTRQMDDEKNQELISSQIPDDGENVFVVKLHGNVQC